jgi:imidazolonepropionase-like amidohydrolase
MKLLAKIVVFSSFVFATGAQADSFLIRGATIHTMATIGTIQNADVLVENGTISRIGQNLDVPADNFTIIEANGRALTPGFFAGVTNIGIGEVSGVEESMDGGLDFPDMRPEFDVTPAYNPLSSLVPVTRIEGYSFTMLGTSGGGTIIGGQGRMVSLDGGFESFAGNYVLFISLGDRAASKTGGSRAGQWMMLEQAMDEADNPTGSNEPGLLTRTGRQVLAQYANGGTVVFSVNRASDILQTIKFAEQFGFKAVISGGAEAWMVAEQLAKAGVAVLLNPLQNLPSSFDSLGSRLDNAALLHAAGVTIGIDGAGSHNARKQRQAAGNAVSYGLPHEAGLAALTSSPAKMFGVADQQGSIERGKPANLVLWSGDPLEVTSVAEMVVINGSVMEMKSRQTELRDRYLPENPDMPRAYIKP